MRINLILMSDKNSLLLVDPEFDPGTAPDCNLLLKITADSFSYAIIDKSSGQLKAVYDQQECHHVADSLAQQLKTDSYLNLDFKTIKVAVYTENNISIPDALFDRENLNDYAQFFTEAQSDQLYVRPVARFGFTTIFSLQAFLDETLSASLMSCKLFDHSAPALAMLPNNAPQTLALDFTASSFNAMLTNDEQLVFHNYYAIENSEEFNYYLLFILNQLKINPAETQVQLSGIIHEQDAHYQCVAKYFKDILFNTPLSDQLDHRILDDMPAHYYSSLLALDLCE